MKRTTAPSSQRVGNFSYNTGDVLGKGAFSTVYLGRCLSTNEKVAIKTINLRIPHQKELIRTLKNEIYVLTHLPAHPNVLKFIHLQQKSHLMCIVTELCEQRLSPNNCKNIDQIASGIINGMKHLWKHGVVHRDLKIQNIMIKEGVPKIIDFGFAKVISNPDDVMVEQMGTPLYMSPQLLEKKYYTSKCDIWSLGIMLYELLFKLAPFPANNLKELVEKVKTSNPIIYKGYSRVLQSIIEQCLVKDQGRRLSWKGLFELGEQLGRPKVKQPETVYEYLVQWIGTGEEGCWGSSLRSSSIY